MSVNRSFRYLALGVATCIWGFSAAAFAQQGNPDVELVGVNARLAHTIDSNSVQRGQAVAAKLDGTITSDGVKLDRGTELLGTVADSAASAHGGPSSVTLLFTRAQMKDGKQIPVKVTLLGAYPASQGDQAAYGQSMIPSAPRHVDPQQKVVQQSGLLGGVELKSSVQGQNSGTFWREDGNFKLRAGTFLQVAVAPVNGTGTLSGE